MKKYFIRNPSLTVLTNDGECYLSIKGASRPVKIACRPLLLRVLQEASKPIPEDLINELGHSTIQTLLDNKILLSGDLKTLHKFTAGFTTKEKKIDHLLLCISGAIGSYNAVQEALGLLRHFAGEIDVILTSSAEKFVSKETFTYFGIKTWTDAFAIKEGSGIPHIQLGQKTDLILVWPTSANTAFKLAHGSCNDLLSLAIAASKAPVVLVPGMNEVMWNSPAVQRNMEQLRQDGYYIIEPTTGLEANDLSSNTMYGCPGAQGTDLINLLNFIIKK